MHSLEKLNHFLPDLLDLRRHLHSHPELSGEEHQTAALVAGELRRYGLYVKEAVGRTGVLAEIGPRNGPLVGLRFDMDALPIEEQTNLPYASLRQGVMHACGHDFHTCIGLGVARLLAEQKFLKTGVRLLFQSAEETAQGARWMRDDGAIEGLNALFGLHVFPDLPLGKIGIKSGSLTAAAGQLEVELIGEAGHGARPHESIDTIWLAGRVITGLQEAISRRLDALNPVVISFGRIQGGKAFNVIADRVSLLGTVRFLDPKLQEHLPAWIEKTVVDISSSFGAKALVTYKAIAPPVHNDHELTALIERSAISLLGMENVVRLEKPSLGAEDFAELLQGVRGSMFRLGVAGVNGCAPLHNAHFAPEEESMEIGIQVLFLTLMEWMEKYAEFSSKD